MRRHTVCCVLLFLPLAGFLGGCGPKGGTLNEVTGTVLFDNQPLEDGIIDFEPLDSQGSKQGASIVKGEYKIPKTKGLMAGRYKVSILAGDGMSGSGNAGAAPGKAKTGGSPGVERAPPEYNTNSKQIVEIKDSEPNKFDFSVPARKG
jgi:hypothetical protein